MTDKRTKRIAYATYLMWGLVIALLLGEIILTPDPGGIWSVEETPSISDLWKK